jgi:hypothetical protein
LEPLGVVLVIAAVVIVAVVVARVLRGPREIRSEEEPPARPDHRVTELCALLSGDAARDRPLLNRILSLGPTVVPMLVDELAETLRNPEGVDAARLARLEELVADFGLAAVGPLAARMARIQPTAPLGPSLTRVLRRLGAPGAVAFLRAALDQPALAAFLPRWRLSDGGHDPAPVLLAALRERPLTLRRRDLDTLAGLLADHPTVIDTLWARWEEAGRVTIVEWLCDWLPLADARLARRALADPAPGVQRAAAALAELLADPELLPALQDLARDPQPASRMAAARALAAFEGAEPALEAAAADPDPEVAVRGVLGLLARDRDAAVWALGNTALAGDARGRLLSAALRSEPDREPLLAALESADPRLREVAISALAVDAPSDPRARERLIRAADGEDPQDRAVAVAALAFAGDSTAPDLLARAVREAPERRDLLRLQRAARALGAAALLPLARRLRSEAPERIAAQLAILRAQPYAAAVAPLLRALESARLGEIEGALTATLHVGGPEVQAALHDGLLQPGRGLLTPTLRYLASYSTPADLPLLVELFDHHPPLRNVLLNLIEAQGAPAASVLVERVRRGGEDAVLLALEQRLEVVRTCTVA